MAGITLPRDVATPSSFDANGRPCVLGRDGDSKVFAAVALDEAAPVPTVSDLTIDVDLGRSVSLEG